MVIVDESQAVGLGVVAYQATGQAQREKGNPYLIKVHFYRLRFRSILFYNWLIELK